MYMYIQYMLHTCTCTCTSYMYNILMNARTQIHVHGALPCCLFDLACLFFSSHLSLEHVYTSLYISHNYE